MLLKFICRCIACLFLLSALVFSSGCISARYTTNIHPPADPASILKGYRFDIVDVAYTREGSKMAGSAPMDIRPEGISNAAAAAGVWNSERWRKELMKTAVKRYPTIFSYASDAYPLSVAIHMKARTSIPLSITLEVVTLTIFGGFLPLPMREVCDVHVAPALLLDDGAELIPVSTVGFQRRDAGWVSVFTPLALIPVPGPSDRRETIVLNINNPEDPGNIPIKGMELSLEGCVDAIVLALQASDQDIRNALIGRSLNSGLDVP